MFIKTDYLLADQGKIPFAYCTLRNFEKLRTEFKKIRSNDINPNYTDNQIE